MRCGLALGDAMMPEMVLQARKQLPPALWRTLDEFEHKEPQSRGHLLVATLYDAIDAWRVGRRDEVFHAQEGQHLLHDLIHELPDSVALHHPRERTQLPNDRKEATSGLQGGLSRLAADVAEAREDANEREDVAPALCASRTPRALEINLDSVERHTRVFRFREC